MPIKTIAGVGDVEEHGALGAAQRSAAVVLAAAAGIAHGSGRAGDSGAVAGLSEDAGDGDRGTDRLDALDPGVAGPGGGAAAGVSAAGSRLAHQLCRRRDRAVRPVVSADRAAGRVRPDPDREPAAGADDDHRLCPLAVRGADSVPDGGGPVRGLVAVALDAGGGAAGAGLGRRGCDRPVARRPGRAHRRLSGLPRHAGREGADLPPGRSGGQGPDRTGPRLSRALVPARPPVRLAGRLQPAAAAVAGTGQSPAEAGPGLRPRPAARGGPDGDAATAAGGADDRLAGRDPAAAGSLRPARRQRLLGLAGRDRPPSGADRRPRPGPGILRRPDRRRPPTGLGEAPDDQRSRPSQRRRGAAPSPDRAAPGDRTRGRAALPGRLRHRPRPGRRSGLMASTKQRDVDAEIAFLTRALKAPTLRESVARLADRGRGGPPPRGGGCPASPTGPARRAGPRRSSSSPACNARSPPATRTAARAGSGPPASPPARAWRSSTSTTPASNATSSPIS